MDLPAMGVGDIVQLLGALGLGSAGGWVSGGVSAVWKAKHDRLTRLEEHRRERIALWKQQLTDPKNLLVPTASLPVYQEAGHLLSGEDLEMIRTGVVGDLGKANTVVVNGMTYYDIRINDRLLYKVAEREREWGLI